MMDHAAPEFHRVSVRQYQIFDLYAFQNWSVADVARTLRVNTAQVYLAKHRVSALFKKEVSRLEQLENDLS